MKKRRKETPITIKQRIRRRTRESITSKFLTTPPRHLFFSFRHRTWRCLFVPAALALSLAGPVGAHPGKQKSSKLEEIERQSLLYGTVFTEQGFALYGAEAKVRRASEKKFRWEAYSDHRGEFAIRVPEGGKYEIVVKAKGYLPMTRNVDAVSGGREDLVFRMQRRGKGKKK